MHRSRSFAALTATLLASAALAAQTVLLVNDTKLSDQDLKVAMQVAASKMPSPSPGQPPNQGAVMQRAVDQLIARALLLQAAREAKIMVGAADVNAIVEQQRTAQGAAFDGYLKELGLSEREYKSRLEDQLMVRRFVDTKVAPGANVTEAEALAFYDANPAKFDHPEELRVRTILLRVDPNTDDMQANAVKTRAEEARKRLLVGEDMGLVAKAVSEDPSKERGGELGWIRKGMLLPAVEAAVWALKAGELTGILKSPLGYHIFLVEERRAAGRVSFDEVKGRLIEALKSDRLATAVENLVKERRAKATIQALDPGVKAALEGLQPSLVAVPPPTGQPWPGPAATAPKRP
jgi:parvulin-like peptidyl-prolyl isomerase